MEDELFMELSETTKNDAIIEVRESSVYWVEKEN